MALELATAFVRVKASGPQTTAEFRKVRSRIQKTLGTINVLIVPKVHLPSLARAQNMIARSMTGIPGGGLTTLGQSRFQTGAGARRSAAPRGFGGTSTSIAFGGGGGRGGGRGTRPLPGAGGGGRGQFLPSGARGAAQTMGGASRVRSGGFLFGGNVQDFVRTSGQIAVGILGAQAALGALSFPVQAVRTASEFEQSMVDVEIATGATAEQMSMLQKVALEMTAKTKFRANEVADSLSILARKGLDVQEVLDISPNVLALATIADVTPERAADLLVGVKNSMKLTSDQLADATNILTRVSIKSSADFEQFAQAFKFAGPLGGLAGLKLKDIAALIGVLADTEIKGSLGGTGLRTILLELANVEKISKVGQLLGKDFTPLLEGGEFKDFPAIIDEISESLQGMSKTQIIDFARQVFNKRGASAFAALIQQGGDAVRGLRTELGEGLTALEAAEMKMNTMKGSADRMRAAFDILSIRAVQPFKEGLEAVGNAIANMIRDMAFVDKPIPRFIALTVAVSSLGIATMFTTGALRLMIMWSFRTLLPLSLMTSAIVLLWGEGETLGEKLDNVFTKKIPDAIDLAKFAFRNLPQIVERMGIQMELALFEAIPGMVSVFERFGIVVVSIFDGIAAAWRSTIKTLEAGLSAMSNFAGNLAQGVSFVDAFKMFAKEIAKGSAKGGGNPFTAFRKAMEETRKKAEEGFADIPLDEGLKKRLQELDAEIARREAEFNRRKRELGKGDGDRGEGGGAGGRRGGFRPKFLGIEELSKQIQLQLLTREDPLLKANNQIVENTKAGSETLVRIEEKMGTGAVFG